MKKGDKKTIHVFDDRNVSELHTNGNTACYLKNVHAVIGEYLVQKPGTRGLQIGSQTTVILMMPVRNTSSAGSLV